MIPAHADDRGFNRSSFWPLKVRDLTADDFFSVEKAISYWRDLKTHEAFIAVGKQCDAGPAAKWERKFKAATVGGKKVTYSEEFKALPEAEQKIIKDCYDFQQIAYFFSDFHDGWSKFHVQNKGSGVWNDNAGWEGCNRDPAMALLKTDCNSAPDWRGPIRRKRDEDWRAHMASQKK
ncbi:hypothetical protein GCM10027256_30600 [Novispirillum itersonii subsp. nipponicum]